MAMEIDKSCSPRSKEEDVEEEEYVLLDLSDVAGVADITPGTPFVLSGLDTLNPILTIGDDLKLNGEYEETIGTCLAFSENEKAAVAHEQMGPSEANLFKGTCIVDPSQASIKEVKPIASLHKILRFRLLPEAESNKSEDPIAEVHTRQPVKLIEAPNEGRCETDTRQPRELTETPAEGQLSDLPRGFGDRETVLALSQERQNFRQRQRR
ncbi:hypothetical protein Dimus_018995 [Dionaea muscipula]